MSDSGDRDDDAAQVAWRVADVAGWPKWMQVPALGHSITPVVRRVIDAVDAHRASRPAAEVSVSDGYHTFDELYEFRLLYHAHAVRAWLASDIPVVRSWRHHDGELCFGGGWFIVAAQLSAGQVSNHYPAAEWSLFDGVPEVERPPAWDGHSSSDVAHRLRAALTDVDGGAQ